MKIIKLEKYRCNYCDLLELYLNERENPVEHTTYNIEDQPEMAAKYGVMSVPSLILEDAEGNVVKQVNGFFRDQVDELLETFEKEA